MNKNSTNCKYSKNCSYSADCYYSSNCDYSAGCRYSFNCYYSYGCHYSYNCYHSVSCYHSFSCDYSVDCDYSRYLLFCVGQRFKENMVFNVQLTDSEVNEIGCSIDVSGLTLTEWVNGKLKVYDYKEAWQNWWKIASDEQKKSITNIKYFDKDIFKEITGIDVDKEVEELTLEQVCERLGKTIKIIK